MKGLRRNNLERGIDRWDWKRARDEVRNKGGREASMLPREFTANKL